MLLRAPCRGLLLQWCLPVGSCRVFCLVTVGPVPLGTRHNNPQGVPDAGRATTAGKGWSTYVETSLIFPAASSAGCTWELVTAQLGSCRGLLGCCWATPLFCLLVIVHKLG